MTVENLLHTFMRSYVEKKLKDNTIRGYRVNINNHIIPFMGDIEIESLSYDLLDDFCDHLKEKGLNRTTTRYVLSVLRKALNFAKRRKYITIDNIFTTYDLPRKERFDYITLEAEECQKLLEYFYERDDDIFLCVYFALRHGLRRGECLGIKGGDIRRDRLYICRSVNFDGSNLVTSDCKTESSRREILLDGEDFSFIHDYDSTRERNADGYLCRNHDGELISTNVIQHHFRNAVSACKLPKIRFHDLRHTFATRMMEAGEDPEVLSMTLGHSDISTTLGIYNHALPSRQKTINERTHNFLPKKKRTQE